MTPEAVLDALDRVAVLLRNGGFDTHALDVENLTAVGRSADPFDLERFRRTMTEDKWYWLGMGTIADLRFEDREMNRQFIQAYFDLAEACEEAGLGSRYSRDGLEIFGSWLREGAV